LRLVRSRTSLLCCRRTRSSRLDALGAACFKNAKQNTKHQKHQTAPPLKYETSITMFFLFVFLFNRLAANTRHTLTHITPRARSIIGTTSSIRYPPSCGALYTAHVGNAVLTLAAPPARARGRRQTSRFGCAAASEVGLGSPPSTPPRTLHSSPYALLGGKGGGGGGGREHATQRVQLSSQHRSDMQNDTAYTRHKSRTPHDSRLRSGCDARRYASPCVYRLVH
jgi:hypothetical protein